MPAERTLYRYRFEHVGGVEASSWTTSDESEALSFALKEGCRVIADAYIYESSEVIADFSEGGEGVSSS